MSGVQRARNGQDGHGLRFNRCMLSRKPYMNEHTTFNRDSKSSIMYEGHIGINGTYGRTIVGADGNQFSTVDTYGAVGEVGFTVGSLRDTSYDNGAETMFDVSIFGGTECGAEMSLTGKTAVGGSAVNRFCLTGDLHGRYAHSLTNSVIGSNIGDLSQGNPQLSSIQAGANVGFSIDATHARLSVHAEAGPEFQSNTAMINEQEYKYQNGVIKANLGVEYVPPMPEGSPMGIVLEANAGLQTPLNIGKNEQGQIQVTGVTDPTNVTPTFGVSIKAVF